MLVLKRRLGERIFLGPGIVLTVADLSRGAVRIGIEAPAGTDVYREEIAPADWVEAAALRRQAQQLKLRKGGGHA